MADAETMVQKKIGLHEDSTPRMIFDTKMMLEAWENIDEPKPSGTAPTS